MAGRDATDKRARRTKTRRRGLVLLGGAVGAVVGAAAMATGSAAPAKADIDALLDPIIQPLVTSLSDSIAGFDPAAAADLTSWADSLLSSLNSLDLALPASAEPAAALAASSGTGVYDIPLSLALGTEPTVNVAVEGGSSVPMLVDTGSSGLVVPWYDVGPLGSGLFSLGAPTGISESGYSGGIDYLYLQYDNATVDYGNGVLTTTNTPIDVEILSWPTTFSPGSPLNFEQFLADDNVSGILGIGNAAADGGPGTSPIEAAGFSGVTVDIPHSEMVIGANSGTPIPGETFSGAPIVTNNLYEAIGSGTPVRISDDLDSGGVYGTIPQSLVGNAGSLPPGTVISVYDNSAGTGTPLYTYTVGTDSLGNSTAPTPVSGNEIDSGVVPFLHQPIYIGYGPNGGTLVFDQP